MVSLVIRGLDPEIHDHAKDEHAEHLAHIHVENSESQRGSILIIVELRCESLVLSLEIFEFGDLGVAVLLENRFELV